MLAMEVELFDRDQGVLIADGEVALRGPLLVLDPTAVLLRRRDGEELPMMGDRVSEEGTEEEGRDRLMEEVGAGGGGEMVAVFEGIP